MDIDDLRRELNRLHGPARIPTLVRIGQTLGMRYWRAGPGSPAALRELSGAIEALAEGYELIGPADPARGPIAGMYGWLLAARYGAHGGAANDREQAIVVLRDAITFGALPPVHGVMTRMSLGQMLLTRSVEAMQPAARAGFLGGSSHALADDADEAIRLFQQVLSGPPISAEVTELAQTMLTLAESLRAMSTGNLAGFDFGRLMNLFTTLQGLREKGFSFGSFPADLADLDPMDYPVPSMRGEAVAPPSRPEPPAAAPADPGAARRLARDRLSALTGTSGRPVWEQAVTLLRAGPSAIPAAELDALVGAAGEAFAASDDGDPVEAGLDHLVSAAALYVRERRDGSGWEDDDTAFDAAGREIAAALDAVPPTHPAAAAVVESAARIRLAADDPDATMPPWTDTTPARRTTGASAAVETDALFVVNPRGDRDAGMADVLVLRRLFYPRSVCVGRGLESVDRAGTRDDLLTCLPTASMVHLACGLEGTKLQLADGDVLDATGRGLLILTEPTDQPTEAFLDAGFSGVIGWRWPVPDRFAALALFLTHLMLIDRRLPPAAAVNSVHRWMLDPGRERPPFMTRDHLHTVETMDVARPLLWAALAHHGS